MRKLTNAVARFWAKRNTAIGRTLVVVALSVLFVTVFRLGWSCGHISGVRQELVGKSEATRTSYDLGQFVGECRGDKKRARLARYYMHLADIVFNDLYSSYDDAERKFHRTMDLAATIAVLEELDEEGVLDTRFFVKRLRADMSEHDAMMNKLNSRSPRSRSEGIDKAADLCGGRQPF